MIWQNGQKDLVDGIWDNVGIGVLCVWIKVVLLIVDFDCVCLFLKDFLDYFEVGLIFLNFFSKYLIVESLFIGVISNFVFLCDLMMVDFVWLIGVLLDVLEDCLFYVIDVVCLVQVEDEVGIMKVLWFLKQDLVFMLGLVDIVRVIELEFVMVVLVGFVDVVLIGVICYCFNDLS